MTYSAFNRHGDNEPKRYYNIRILKLQPTKILINGRIKDRSSLTPEEHQAVKTKEEIDKARAELKQNK